MDRQTDIMVREEQGKGRYVLVSTHEAPAVGEVVIAGQKVAKLGYTTTLTFVAP